MHSIATDCHLSLQTAFSSSSVRRFPTGHLQQLRRSNGSSNRSVKQTEQSAFKAQFDRELLRQRKVSFTAHRFELKFPSAQVVGNPFGPKEVHWLTTLAVSTFLFLGIAIHSSMILFFAFMPLVIYIFYQAMTRLDAIQDRPRSNVMLSLEIWLMKDTHALLGVRSLQSKQLDSLRTQKLFAPTEPKASLRLCGK